MDNGPLWSQDENGHYWLLFPNKHALNRSQINEIFSEFGKVTSITAAGDERGFRFIQYSCLEDVEKAVCNLKNHPLIKLVPHRPKNKNNQNSDSAPKNGNNDIFMNKLQENDNNGRRNFFQRKPLKIENIKLSNNSCTLINQKSNNDNDNHESILHSINNVNNITNNDNSSICNSSISDNTLNSSGQYLKYQFLKHSSQENIAHDKLIDTDLTKKLLKLRGICSHTFSLSDVSNDINHTESNNEFDSKNIICDDEIPDLVKKDRVKLYKEPKKILLNAEEIIVANIPDDCGSAYILHLFEKFDPLAISYIKLLPKTLTRYCHVYFKTAEDSIGVETLFDKYDLAGKKLIVLRPCRLMEEGS